MAQQFSGERLRSARVAAGLRREALATAIDRSAQSITSYELGRAVPSVAALTSLDAALDIRVGDLFEDKAALAGAV
jgi:transcriptional regulator with XRE-family HTH domain